MHARLCRAWLAVTLLLLLGGPARAEHRIEVGGGGHLFLDSDVRAAYGTGMAFDLGYLARFASTPGWFLVRVGYARTSGAEIAADRTFELGDATLSLVPIDLGISAELPRTSSAATVRLTAAWRNLLATWEDEFGASQTTGGFGAAFEFQPQVDVAEGIRLWARQRLAFVSDLSFDTRNGEIAASHMSFQVGLALTMP